MHEIAKKSVDIINSAHACSAGAWKHRTSLTSQAQWSGTTQANHERQYQLLQNYERECYACESIADRIVQGDGESHKSGDETPLEGLFPEGLAP